MSLWHRTLFVRVLFLLLGGFSLLLPQAVSGDTRAAEAGRDRHLLVLEDTDYFGKDFEILKEVELDVCQAACLEDLRCQAFTYNRKARWCFLKSEYREARPFLGAVSGHLAPATASVAARRVERLADLAFLSRDQIKRAADQEAEIAALPQPIQALGPLQAAARKASESGAFSRAAGLYKSLLRLDSDNASIWLEWAMTLLRIERPDWQSGPLRKEAMAAIVNGYARALDRREQAASLALLGKTLELQSLWRPAIRAYRAALERTGDSQLRATYEQILARHGFRILKHRVDSDAEQPRLCLELSDPLPREKGGLADYVQVEDGRGLAVEVEDRQICVDGVRHGERYRVRVRAGLPAADGETLAKTADLDIYVRDRTPTVRFLGRSYVLPRGGEAAIPLVSVNSTRVAAKLYRIGDRGVVETLGEGDFLQALSEREAETLRDHTGEALWEGELEVASRPNREVTTTIPIASLIREPRSGVYILTARATEAAETYHLATQWFVVSDLGLATYSGHDGLHALVRSLSTAEPSAAVRLRLVARNDEILGRAVTDATGYARFEPGLLRGRGGNRPALLVAEGADGDYAFLDLEQNPFDLSDRGVEGRASPKPVDVFLTTERGLYRPGETVHFTALARDAQARARTDLPLTLVVKRPDGVEYRRAQLADGGLGGHHLALELRPTALHGTWRGAVYGDPQAPALAEKPFLVEDFQPERLTFELTTQAQFLDPEDPPELHLNARFLYGAPAAGLEVEGELVLEPTDRLEAHPGYRFGLADEPSDPTHLGLPEATTDAAGHASLVLAVTERPRLSRPLRGRATVRVFDGGGRPVERSHQLAVRDGQARLGLRPLFEGSVDEGGNAVFEVIALDAEGARLAQPGVRWTLSRVQTRFQWYQTDGNWDYEPVVHRERIASGRVDLDAKRPVRIEAPVAWGGYELQVAADDDRVVPASLGFDAGWYVAPTAIDTPDRLKVSLDKPSYRVGEKARVHLEPRFAGLALVLVLDDRLVAMTTVAVPREGATLELPVTADWGPGAYVTATLYRPMDLDAGRMPARAIGLTWAGVDPGLRRLDMRLEPAARVAPRAPLELDLSLANLAPGEEAYAVVAAVDVGILNLTRYQTPAPDDWYFGQRRLGMEMRDLYGRLIDRLQGVPGVLRSGGDGGLINLAGLPPTEELAAFHSGILRVDDAGRARVVFDLPDFNGTLRVMAMAWTASGVGHAAEDVLVRDPIVVQPSLPRFLAPGDQTRLLLELSHVEGPAGRGILEVETEGDGLRLESAAAHREYQLAAGERATLTLPLRALRIGEHRLHLHLKTPDGRLLSKRLTLPVRANRPAITQSSLATLSPGGPGLTLSTALLTGLEPGTGAVRIAATGAGRLDVPGLLQALDRYPYGCAEQLVSRALPLLYLDEVALAAGLDGEPEAGPRIRAAMADLLGKQGSDGGFGLWGPGSDSLWLNAYVTDFLTRAREQGYAVPETVFTLALDNLRNTLSYTSDDFESGGEDLAYALYVLARNARAVIGDLRYYVEARLEHFATALARAQLGAALALYGDRSRADKAFRAALERLESPEDDEDGWREDYGSELRDAAAVLALAAESGTTVLDRRILADKIAALQAGKAFTNTQEQAWMLLAAQALMQETDAFRLTLGGLPVASPVLRRFTAETLGGAPRVLANRGPQPVEVRVTTTGVPVTAPPAGGEGYGIERAYYDLEGRRVRPERLSQGQRLVAVLSIQATQPREARLVIEDPLPAGFEIDNPHLIRAGELQTLSWMRPLDHTEHQEFRADRFVAAVHRGTRDDRRFQLAYRLRAVSPGQFLHPAATVEDMYRPQLRAWSDEGQVIILPGRP